MNRLWFPRQMMFNAVIFAVATAAFASLTAPAREAPAHDCTHARPFVPFEAQKVSITVDRIFPQTRNDDGKRRSERLCESASPIEIGAFDIRGREEEWYFCFYQTERPLLECSAGDGRISVIIRPAVVLRTLASGDLRDSHFHLFVVLQGKNEPVRDTFIRASSSELSKRDLVLEAVSAGRGARDEASPGADQNEFAVRVRYF